ncbi:ion channel [Variovorax rhizosphaerae]|uniref:Ion channel n=1 Tax=Variovorax rhizosphaerae TaxID=1836200 RepID=A0ABU8WC07_9BURK
MIDLLAWVISIAMIGVSVEVHYRAMTLISDRFIPWGLQRFDARRTLLLAMMALMLGHFAEIGLYGLALHAMSLFPQFGSLAGTFDGKVGDFVYYSAVNYTSLGYGEVYPVGPIRVLAVTECLTGLMMIGWSTSFTYLKMEQLWQARAAKVAGGHAGQDTH